jgi:CopA family copper-resistance protein
MARGRLRRREILRGLGASAVAGTFGRLAPAYAWADARQGALPPRPPGGVDAPGGEPIHLSVDSLALSFSAEGRTANAIALNGSIPGPLLRLREGQEAVIRVTNHLDEITSIHWHGLILPPEMDGVPGVSFAGIQPRSVFTYRFPVRQSGTYWAHSHSGGQELLGLYFPLIIDPAEPEPFSYDRDYVVMLSDWSFESPERIVSKLKKQAGYYNYQRRTAGDFFRDVGRNGLLATLGERLAWSKMRMDPTDFADVTGFTYTYLLNGLPPDANWTGLFRPGERVRLRFIDAGAMTFFDVRIPGLKMTLVQADGQNVRPVVVEEFRIAPGETYDVLVEPEERAYTIFAEALDRSGYTRGTLAPREGMVAEVPPRRPRPLRTMADMGMDMSGMETMEGMGSQEMGGEGKARDSMPGMDLSGHGAHGMKEMNEANARALEARDSAMKGHDMAGMAPGGLMGPALPGGPPVMHGPDTHGPGNSSVAMVSRSRLDEPGSGFEQSRHKVLAYTDLESLSPQPDPREPEREVELHITGNMERYMWSFDGKKYSEARTPILFRHGERLRMVLVNDTMMEHPIHLHGMWMELENGRGQTRPRKHTVVVKPAERVSVAITADAPGRWAMHCHLLLHMEMGMFRVVEVSAGPTERAP